MPWERATPGGSVVPAAKLSILKVSRPAFSGAAAKMKCGTNMSRNHLLSWESIRDGYYAALNPGSTNSCDQNLALLYDSVGLTLSTQDVKDIKAACSSSNLSNNSVTTADQTVLDTLNSSTANLRCGHASSNQSVGGALDVPCSNQTYNSSKNRIEISGTAASRLTSFLSIDTTNPQPPYFYKTNQSCGGSGTCSNTRIQTSDCINDVGASQMPSSNAPVYYDRKGTWTQL